MSGTEEQWRDTGSNSGGRLQHVVANARAMADGQRIRAYRIYLNHMADHTPCPPLHCPERDRLWREYQGEPGS